MILEMYLKVLSKLVIYSNSYKIVAVTGSVGKTTTATIVYQVLSNIEGCNGKKFPKVRTTVNNMNDTVGLPLTILNSHDWISFDFKGISQLFKLLLSTIKAVCSAKEECIYVLEYGVGGPGEMALLTDIVKPDVAIITAIGPAHIERFLSEVNISKEKEKLMDAVGQYGMKIFGSDNEFTKEMSHNHKKSHLVSGKGVDFAISTSAIVAKFFGATSDEVDVALIGVIPPSQRLEIEIFRGVTIINDSYNANPLSMKYALDILEKEVCSGKKIAILGDMKELGCNEKLYHEEIGAYAHEKADYIIGVGNLAYNYNADFWFEDVNSLLTNELFKKISKNDCVLFKASNSGNFNKLVETFKVYMEDSS